MEDEKAKDAKGDETEDKVCKNVFHELIDSGYVTFFGLF